MAQTSRHLLRIHAAVLLFGFAGLFGDARLLSLTPIVIVFGRVVFAALTLLLVGLVRRDILGPLSGRSLLAFAALGALLAMHWTTFFQAVQTSSVALALITYSTFPVFVAFLEPLFFREKLRTIDVVLAVLALAGIAVLKPGWNLEDRATQGLLWGVASGLTFALLSLLNRRFVRQHSSLTIALYQDVFAAAALLPFVLADWRAFTIRDVLLLIVLGVLCTAVAHALFIAGLHGIPARTASMIACLEPVYGTLLAVLFFGDLPSARTLLGGAIVLGAAFYATLRAGREKEPRDRYDREEESLFLGGTRDDT
jgi:drug/metabolite transporter (DMT)-like permease